MFNQVDVQPVPGDGVLHRNNHTLVLVTLTPTTDESESLSVWARQSPNTPLPDVKGVAALGWADGQFHFHATGPMLIIVTSSSGQTQLELGDNDAIRTLSLTSVDVVECRHLQHKTEMPDPFETLSSGTTSASGFIASVQMPLPVEDSQPLPTQDAPAETESQQPPSTSAIDEEPPPTPQSKSDAKDDDPAPTLDGRSVPPAPPQPAVPPQPPTIPPEPNKNSEIEFSDIFVLGVICPRCETFNHPNAPYCFVDGHRLVETRVLQRAKRPTLGHLRLNHDGTHIQLLKTVVLGRAPDISPLVENKDAEGVQLEDPSISLSRSHAVLELRDWDVYLRDDGSQNGTWVIAADGSRRRLSAGEEIELGQETTFSLGQSIITFVPAPLK